LFQKEFHYLVANYAKADVIIVQVVS